MRNADQETHENIAPSTKYQVPSTKYQVPSTKYQVPSTKYQVPSTKYQVPSTQFFRQLFCLVLAFFAFSLPGIASAADYTQLYPAIPIPFGAKPTPVDRRDPALATTPMTFYVSVGLRDRPGLEQYVMQAATPGNRNYGVWLTPDQVAANYGPTADQITAVTQFLTSNNLTVVDVASSGLLVKATGLPATIESAFHTRIGYYTLRDGRNVFLPTTPVSIPGSLTGIVKAVSGLDNLNRMRPFAAPPRLSSSQVAASQGGYTIADFAKIYGASNTPGLPDAGSIKVGIITMDSVSEAITALQSSRAEAGNSNPVHIDLKGAITGPVTNPFSIYNTDGSAQLISWDPEMRLDLQALVGMAGEVNSLLLYGDAQNNYINAISHAQTDGLQNGARVISISFGTCEWGYQKKISEDVFLSMASQGQTVFVSTGDGGSTCAGVDDNTKQVFPFGVNYPASDSYVVAVGGTKLPPGQTSTTNEIAYSSYEILDSVTHKPVIDPVTNTAKRSIRGSGGGVSKDSLIMPWQQSMPEIASLTTTHRALPDASLPAEGGWINVTPGLTNGNYTIVNGGYTYEGAGGTSLAAPMMAGMWARLLASGCNPNLGFAAPWLYSHRASTMFHDITQGTSQTYHSPPGKYNTGPGWDAVTGLGSLNAANMLAVCNAETLANPPPTIAVSHSPVNPVAGGNVNLNWAATNSTLIVVDCFSSRVTGWTLTNYTLSTGVGQQTDSVTLPLSANASNTDDTCIFTAHGPGGRKQAVDTFTVVDPHPSIPTAKSFLPATRSILDAWGGAGVSYDYENATSVSYSCQSTTATSFWPPGPKVFHASTGTYTYPVDPFVVGPGAKIVNNLSTLAGSTNVCTWTATGPGGDAVPFVDTWTVAKVSVMHYPATVVPGHNLEIHWALSPDVTALDYSCTSGNGGWNSSGSKPTVPAIAMFSITAPVVAHSTTTCTWTGTTPDGPVTTTDTWVVP